MPTVPTPAKLPGGSDTSRAVARHDDQPGPDSRSQSPKSAANAPPSKTVSSSPNARYAAADISGAPTSST